MWEKAFSKNWNCAGYLSFDISIPFLTLFVFMCLPRLSVLLFCLIGLKSRQVGCIFIRPMMCQNVLKNDFLKRLYTYFFNRSIHLLILKQICTPCLLFFHYRNILATPKRGLTRFRSIKITITHLVKKKEKVWKVSNCKREQKFDLEN